jgi:hypothetical protein
MQDIFLEARAQLAYARMAAAWLDAQVDEHMRELESATPTVERSAPELKGQAEFFRNALHPALSGSIVLSVYSLMEHALQRIADRHQAYDRKGARIWNQTEGSGVLRTGLYLRKVAGPGVAEGPLLAQLDDLRVVRNHIAHRGPDFRGAPKMALEAARRHDLLSEGLQANLQRILAWMFELHAALLDALEKEFARHTEPGNPS